MYGNKKSVNTYTKAMICKTVHAGQCYAKTERQFFKVIV